MELAVYETPQRIRKMIKEFEIILAQHPDAQFGDQERCPVEHVFGGGTCIRSIFIPKGMVVVGKIHKHAHPNFLMQGEVIVITEGGGRQRLKAPHMMISEPGTKRVVYALEDTIWAVVHVTDAQTPEELEKDVIAPSYEALGSESPEACERIGV
jgi:quercetin dioxygenase-like cupin family protein